MREGEEKKNCVRTILGIDPGTNLMGYGVIRVEKNKPSLVVMGVLDLRKYADPYIKLQKIFTRTLSLIDEYKPEELAIESQFFGKNVQSMLKLGRAQGVAIAAAAYRNLSIHEYAPLKIKMSLTGNGMASKEQIAEMVRKLLKVQKEEMSTFFDATDGVAAAICHFFQSRNTIQEKKFNSWTDFVAQNKSKVSRPARTAKTVKTDNSQ